MAQFEAIASELQRLIDEEAARAPTEEERNLARVAGALQGREARDVARLEVR